MLRRSASPLMFGERAATSILRRLRVQGSAGRRIHSRGEHTHMVKQIFVGALVFALPALAADFKKESMAVPASELKWDHPWGPQGPEVAVVSGDAKKGPASAFMKFPAGYDSGWHTHDGWYVSTVVKGTM